MELVVFSLQWNTPKHQAETFLSGWTEWISVVLKNAATNLHKYVKVLLTVIANSLHI